MTLVVTSPVNNALKCDSEVVDTSTDSDIATATGTDVYQGTHMTLVVAGPVSNALSVTLKLLTQALTLTLPLPLALTCIRVHT